MGCGYENVSSAKVLRHMSTCEQYAEVYRTRPEAALGPEEAMEAHRAFRQSDEGQEAKSERKADRLDKWVEFQNTKSDQAARRWAGEVSQRALVGVPLTRDEVLDLSGARMYGEAITEDLEGLSPTERVIREGSLGSL